MGLLSQISMEIMGGHLTVWDDITITQLTDHFKREAEDPFYTKKCSFLQEAWEEGIQCDTLSLKLKNNEEGEDISWWYFPQDSFLLHCWVLLSLSIWWYGFCSDSDFNELYSIIVWYLWFTIPVDMKDRIGSGGPEEERRRSIIRNGLCSPCFSDDENGISRKRKWLRIFKNTNWF